MESLSDHNLVGIFQLYVKIKHIFFFFFANSILLLLCALKVMLYRCTFLNSQTTIQGVHHKGNGPFFRQRSLKILENIMTTIVLEFYERDLCSKR